MNDQDKLTPHLLSACTTLATAELTKPDVVLDEEAVITRANEIFQDAVLPEPVTDQGKQAREQALNVVAIEATAKANEKPKFDYDQFRDETAIVAVSDIFKKVGELADYLPIPAKTTPEYEKNCEESYDKLVLSSFEILNTRNVGMSQYKYVFDSMKAVISALEDQMMQQMVGHRHEIMSRELGAKNPGTGKFDGNYATYAELIAHLKVAREATGNVMEDYFNIVPKEQE